MRPRPPAGTASRTASPAITAHTITGRRCQSETIELFMTIKMEPFAKRIRARRKKSSFPRILSLVLALLIFEHGDKRFPVPN